MYKNHLTQIVAELIKFCASILTTPLYTPFILSVVFNAAVIWLFIQNSFGWNLSFLSLIIPSDITLNAQDILKMFNNILFFTSFVIGPLEFFLGGKFAFSFKKKLLYLSAFLAIGYMINYLIFVFYFKNNFIASFIPLLILFVTSLSGFIFRAVLLKVIYTFINNLK